MNPTDSSPPAASPLRALDDTLIRAVDRTRSVRIVAALSSGLCSEAARRHQTSPAVTCALGRALTASVLLATLTKGGERVTIQLACDGPLGSLHVDTYDDGAVRGYPSRPTAWADRKLSGRQRLADLLGTGIVNVLRDVGLGENYQGQISLVRGEVDEDLEHYLLKSEQVPSALGCEVVQDEAGAVLCARGLLAQVMPDGDTEYIAQIQAGLRSGALYQALREPDITPEALCLALLPEPQVEVLDRRPLRFRCRCSESRIEGMLSTLPTSDLAEMIEEGRPAEITCNYCNHVYLVPTTTLAQIRERRSPRENN